MLSLLQLDLEDEEPGAVAACYVAEVRALLRRLLQRAQTGGELRAGDVGERARGTVEHLLTEWAPSPE